jgi:hypothetical protein
MVEHAAYKTARPIKAAASVPSEKIDHDDVDRSPPRRGLMD